MQCTNDPQDLRRCTAEQLFHYLSSGIPSGHLFIQPVAELNHLQLGAGNDQDALSPDPSPAIKKEIRAFLYELLYPPLFKRALTLGLDADTAEEVVQEKLMYVLIENPGCYDPAKGELLNFLYRCIANQTTNTLKRNARQCAYDESLEALGGEDKELHSALDRVLFEQIIKAIRFTVAEERVLDCWRDGFTKAGDIADELEMNPAAISRLLYDIRKKIEAVWPTT